MKVSKITNEIVVEHCRIDDYNDEEIQNILYAAKAYVRSYTGLTDEEIDTHEEFYIAVLVLCQDMYDNRSMYVDKNSTNKVVESILGMHCINLL